MSALGNTSLISDGNLQGYWTMDSDGSDSSSNGYDLSPNGTISHVSGKFGNAASFDSGSSEYYSIADASCPNLEIAGSQTCGFWVYPNSNPTGGSYFCMGKRGGASIKQVLILDGRAIRVRWDGLSDNIMDTTATLTLSTWNFVCVRYVSGDDVDIWIDDTAANFPNSGSVTDTNGIFSIGGSTYATGAYIDGIIDDAFTFDRALTDGEVSSLYNDSLIKKFSGVAQASLKEVIGVTNSNIASIAGVANQ